MSVKRWHQWCNGSHGHSLTESKAGDLVRYSDYTSLEAKNRELEAINDSLDKLNKSLNLEFGRLLKMTLEEGRPYMQAQRNIIKELEAKNRELECKLGKVHVPCAEQVGKMADEIKKAHSDNSFLAKKLILAESQLAEKDKEIERLLKCPSKACIFEQELEQAHNHYHKLVEDFDAISQENESLKATKELLLRHSKNQDDQILGFTHHMKTCLGTGEIIRGNP